MRTEEVVYTPKLRVLALTPGMAPGGAEQHLATLIRHSHTVEYVRVLAGAPLHGMPASSVSVGRVPVTTVHKQDGEELETAMVRSVSEVRELYDVIFYWGMRGMMLQWTKKPVVHVIHFSATENTNEGHVEWVKEYGHSHANYLVAVSQSGVEGFRPEARKQSSPTVIHNGADVERTRPIFGGDHQRRKWGIPADSSVLLYVGRFWEGKGPERLIQALEYLPEHYVAVMYGWGAMSHQLRDIATRFPGRVFFPQPRLKGLGDVYDAADVVVIPSNSEAFPLVLIEAWQSGTPVVASEFDTINELESMHDQTLVWKIPCPPTPKDVAAAVEQVELMDPRVQAAQQLALQRYSASAMVGRWESFFYQCHNEWFKSSRDGMVEVSQ